MNFTLPDFEKLGKYNILHLDCDKLFDHQLLYMES